MLFRKHTNKTIDILYKIKARKDAFKENHPWMAQNYWVLISLIGIFILAFLLRSYWNFGPATENGFLYVGTDPYYHQRIIEYIQAEHKHLTFDPMLNYPIGSANPRPPVFAWTTAIIGYLLSPFFGGNVDLATKYSSTFAPVLWGSLMIFPIYFITREMFNKKAGIIASFLIAIMPEHIQSSGLGLFDHDQMVLFFILLAIFFYFRAIKTLKDKRYVANWKSYKEIKEGSKNFLLENKIPIGYSLFGAISISTVALIWEGFPYLLAIIAIYYFAQLLVNALRKEDAFGIAIVTLILVGLPLLIIFPYYNLILPKSLIAPFYISLGIFGLTIFFVPTRDIPWIITIPFTIIVIALSLFILDYFYPEIASYLFSGMGYFIVTKVYSTIGEAQPTNFNRLAYSYGVVTFYLAFIGMVICAWQYKKTWKKDRLFILIWSGTAIYMATAAIRFMDNATPIFAILGGFVIYEIIRKLGYSEMMKMMHSLRGDRIYAIKKSIKIRHISGALFIAFLIVFPNLWSAVDAGIPSEIKGELDKKIYDFLPGETDVYFGNTYLFTLPSWKPPNRTYESRGGWYLGAFGQGYLSEYWQHSFAWLKEQDKNITPIEKRPGFISWWDYGFQCIDLAEHPSVADNFQNGYVSAGLFITAQNESSAIAILLIRILEADFLHNKKDFSSKVKDILNKYNVSYNKIIDFYRNPSSYISEVKKNDTKYMGNDIKLDEVTPIVAKYLSARHEFTKLRKEELVSLLSEVQNATSYSIRYFAVDVRMFPFNWWNKGIFYAPVKLTDQRVNENGDSLDYLETIAVLKDGGRKKISELKRGDEVKTYELIYKDNFYRTMFYKAYIGYSGEDLGQTNEQFGIPGIFGNARNALPMQGWMLKHFRVVYRTTYWNPYSQEEVQNNMNAWKQITPEEYLVYSQSRNGTIDIRSGLYRGAQYLEFYEGINISGRVLAGSNGIPDVNITVIDDFGIPHDIAKTDKDGYYQINAPFGLTINVNNTTYNNITLIASVGELNPITKIGRTMLNITTLTNATRERAREGYRMEDINLNLTTVRVNGTVFIDLDNDNKYNETKDELIKEGKVVLGEFPTIYNATIVNGRYDENFPLGRYNVYVDIEGHKVSSATLPVISLEQGKNYTDKNIGIKQGILSGKIKYENSSIANNFTFKLIDDSNKKEYIANISKQGNYSMEKLLLIINNTEYKIERLLFGDYTIEINKENYMKISEKIKIDGEVKKDFTLVRSTEIKGNVFIGNKTIKNAEIKFISESNIRSFAITNENGFSINLTRGNYTVFTTETRNYKTYSYLQKLSVGDEIIKYYNISLEKAVRIYGNIKSYLLINNTKILSNISTEIFFEKNNLTLKTFSNKTGYYEIYLPKGNYSLKINYRYNTTSYIYLGEISANMSKLYNITLDEAVLLSGRIYWDKNNDNIYSAGILGEEAANIEITITNGSNILRTYSTKDGNYNIYIAPNRDYIIKLENKNYHTSYYNISIERVNHTKNFEIIPKNVILSGIVYWDENRNGSYESGEEPYYNEQEINISIWFNSTVGNVRKNIIVNSTNINYSIEILPMEYNINAESNTTLIKYKYRTVPITKLNLKVGENFRRDISLEKFIIINGTVKKDNKTENSVNIEFNAIEVGTDKTVRTDSRGFYSTEIKNGTYGIYSYKTIGGITYSYLANIKINSPLTFNFTLLESYEIKGKVYWDKHGNSTPEDDDNLRAIVKFIKVNNSEGYQKLISTTLGYKTNLPRGDYKIIAEVDKAVVQNDYDYLKFENNISIANNITYNIKLIPKDISFNITAYFDKEKISNLTITFKYANESFSKVIKTNETGNANPTLRVGTYNLIVSPYINNDTTIKYETNYLLPEVNSKIKNQEIPLSKTIKVNGTVYYIENYTQKYAFNSNLVFKSKDKETVVNGERAVYSVYLKPDKYSLNITAEINGRTYFYNEDNINIDSYKGISPTLLYTYKVYGKVLWNNETQNGTKLQKIKFFGKYNFDIPFEEDGSYVVNVPEGNYSIFLQYYLVEYNFTYRYKYKENISVNSDILRNINLTKEQKFGVNLSAISQMNIMPNRDEKIQITLKNIGIEKDRFNIRIMNFTEKWNATFGNEAKEPIELNERQEMKLNLTIRSPNISLQDIKKENNTTANLLIFASSLTENWSSTINITFNIKTVDFEVYDVRVISPIENRKNITISAKVREKENVNYSDNGETKVSVKFYIDDEEIEEIDISVAPGNERNVSTIWRTKPGEHRITVKVIAPTNIEEMSTENNADSSNFSVPPIKWFNLFILIIIIIIAIFIPFMIMRLKK